MKKLMPFIIIFCLIFSIYSSSYAENTNFLTRADAALYIAKELKIEHTNDSNVLYGLFPDIFPGGYNGEHDLSYSDKPMTLEVLMVALVRYIGWDVVHYSNELVTKVKDYVSPEGFPYYQPDPTPRSIPYIVVSIEKGLLNEGEIPNLRKEISMKDMDIYLKRLKEINNKTKVFIPVKVASEADLKNIESLESNNEGKLIIIPKGAKPGKMLTGGNNTVLDFRSSNIRLYNGNSGIATGKQDYFPLGALQTVLSTGLEIPKDSYIHQGEAIYGLVENKSTTANAVGIWGAAKSKAPGARVWGGFLTAESTKGEQNDAQLIGLEIDVLNYSKPGIAPNESKVGMQVVGIGDSALTNGIEVLGAGAGVWHNGVLFANNSIHKDGTVIGLSQKTPVNIGINFSNTPFTTAAMLISNNSLLAFNSKTGNNSAIYTDDISNGNLVLRSGKDGIRVTNNENTANILAINSNGVINSESLLYKRYSSYFIGVIALVLFLFLWNAFLQYQIVKLKRKRVNIKLDN